MIKLSKNHNPNYVASVVKIDKINKIKGDDRIVQVIVDGFSVVVGNDIKAGDIMVFCPAGSVLNADFLKTNNLYSKSELNEEVDAPTGFFDKQGRVRPINLRGIPSEGFLAKTEMFTKSFDESSFEVGDLFDYVSGHKFIEKYSVNTDDKRHIGMIGAKKKHEKVSENFEFHYSTSKLNRNMSKLLLSDIISVTVKEHGTPAVFGRYKRKPNSLKNIIKIIFGNKYQYVMSSRNRIIDDSQSDTVWGKLKKELIERVKKANPNPDIDFTVYGEIVGYHGKSGIQKAHGAVYDYGCKEGENKFHIYRTVTFSPADNMQRKEHSVLNGDEFANTFFGDNTSQNTEVSGVTPLFFGSVKNLAEHLGIDISNDSWRDNLLEAMKFNKKWSMEEDEPMCLNKVPREGVVVRIENEPNSKAMKLKCSKFEISESAAIDSGEHLYES